MKLIKDLFKLIFSRKKKDGTTESTVATVVKLPYRVLAAIGVIWNIPQLLIVELLFKVKSLLLRVGLIVLWLGGTFVLSYFIGAVLTLPLQLLVITSGLALGSLLLINIRSKNKTEEAADESDSKSDDTEVQPA